MTRIDDRIANTGQADDDLTRIGEKLSTPAAVSRRRVLIGGGVAAMTAALAACTSSKTSTATSGTPAATDTSPSTAPSSTSGGSGDIAVATLAAGLEVLAVATYKAALDAAVAGKLGTVPPAVAQFVKTAMAQHQTHLDALNKVITTNGQPMVTAPNATLKPVVDSAFAKVTDAAGAAGLALMLEEIAAQTYLKAIPTLTQKASIMLAGQIYIIDQQHQAILLFALGMYPVPVTFVQTDKAVAS
ncbi:MAG: ferritin-like domain-containing protein [Actinomycetota bacterium]|nr:ferritin-like domain-containing protein [Actinomycetota bacterium]